MILIKTQAVFCLLWMASLLINGERESLLGYNCTADDIVVTEFSLLNDEQCPDFKELAVQEKIAIQLVQRREYKYVHVYAMRVVRLLQVKRCDGFPVTHEISQRVLTLSTQQVMNAYQHNQFKDEYVVLGDLNFNGTKNWQGNLAGWSDEFGYCGGETIHLHGLSYPDALLSAVYEITLLDGLATVNLGLDQVKVLDGTTCKYSDKHCVSLTVGDVVWETSPTDDMCTSETYPVLFDGEALISRYPATSVTEAKQIITLKSDEFAFSLVLTEGTFLCQQVAFSTEHPALFIVVISRLGLRYFKRHPLHPFDINSNVYRDSKFIFVERHLQRQLTQLNNNAMTQICKLELQILANLRATAMIDPTQFGYAYKKQPGYSSLVRGEVLYLIQCVPVQVYWRHTGVCYQEIPVTYLNYSCFLNPRTRILTHFSEELQCNSFYPVKFKIQDTWVAMTPNVVRSTPPHSLTLGINLTAWKYDPVDMTLGIYSLQDLERQRAAVLLPMEYTAITRTIAANAGGFSTKRQGLNMLNMLDPDQFKQVVIGYWEEVANSFKVFGAYSGGIIMIIIIYRALVQACQGSIHFAAVKKIFGFGAGLLACVCPALANLILIYGHENKRNSSSGKATIKGAYNEFKKAHSGRKGGARETETDVSEESELYPIAEIRTLEDGGPCRGGSSTGAVTGGTSNQLSRF